MTNQVVKKYGAYRILKLKTKVNWEARAFGRWNIINSAMLSNRLGVSQLLRKWNRWAGKPDKLIRSI